MKELVVLRIGHRPRRDMRITTHVALVSRAFGATGFAREGGVGVLESLERLLGNWGGKDSFSLRSVESPKTFLKEWKASGGKVVHLTMYGVDVDSKLPQIKDLGDRIAVVVGAGKVEKWYYEIADLNVAVGNQPHSEVAALAIFLDRVNGGVRGGQFNDGRIRVLGSEKGKKVIMV